MRDLEKDLDICNAATPGPWGWQVDKRNGGYSGLSGKDDIEVLYPNHCNDGDDGSAWFDEFPNYADREFIAQAREGWPHAIERAIRAEAAYKRILHEWNFNNEDVKKLQEEIGTWKYEEGVQHTFNCRLEAENARLHKVVEAAREVKGFGLSQDSNSYWSIKKLENSINELDASLDELDANE